MGHRIIAIHSVNRNFFIDTGSPISFGDVNCVEIAGRIYSLNPNPLLKEIKKCLGQGISGVIGMDILNQYNLALIPKEGALLPEITESDLGFRFNNGRSVQLERLIGVPVVTIDINGANHRFFLDTGASSTYINKKLSSAFYRTGYMEDFYPMYGTFKTESYSFQASILRYNFTVNAGILPEFLAILFPGGIDGILGRDVLEQFSTCLAFRSGKFYLKQ